MILSPLSWCWIFRCWVHTWDLSMISKIKFQITFCFVKIQTLITYYNFLLQSRIFFHPVHQLSWLWKVLLIILFKFMLKLNIHRKCHMWQHQISPQGSWFFVGTVTLKTSHVLIVCVYQTFKYLSGADFTMGPISPDAALWHSSLKIVREACHSWLRWLF